MTVPARPRCHFQFMAPRKLHRPQRILTLSRIAR
jgi:hypothetical protein